MIPGFVSNYVLPILPELRDSHPEWKDKVDKYLNRMVTQLSKLETMSTEDYKKELTTLLDYKNFNAIYRRILDNMKNRVSKRLIDKLHDNLKAKEVQMRKIVEIYAQAIENMAKMYLNKGLSKLELMSLGSQGVMDATCSYEPKNRFWIYARHWVKSRITKELLYIQAQEKGLNKNQYRNNRKIKRTVAHIYKTHEKIATSDIAEFLGESEDHINKNSYAPWTLLLDTGEKDKHQIIERYPDHTYNPEQLYLKQDLEKQVKTALAGMEFKRRYVLIKEMGIGCKKTSERIIGEKLGVSHTMVWFWKREAIEQLQSNEALKSYWQE